MFTKSWPFLIPKELKALNIHGNLKLSETRHSKIIQMKIGLLKVGNSNRRQ